MMKSIKILLAIGAVALAVLLICLSLLLVQGKKPSGNWQEQYDLGIRYLSEGNYEEAIIAFTAAIEIDSKQSLPYIGRGDAYIGSGENARNLTAAQADYEAAISLEETNADAWLGLADVHIRRGDYDKAMEVLREALEKTGNDPAITDKLAQIESGNISDSSGNARRRSSYDAGGVLLWWHDMAYNEQGQETSVTAYDGSGNQIGHIDLAYDERGNRLVSYAFMLDGTLVKQEDEYDDAGNLVRIYHFNKNGERGSYSQYTYDEKGNRIRIDFFSSVGKLTSYILNEYDANGNLTKESDYDSSGELEGYTIYEYNERGKGTEYRRYSKNDILEMKGVRIYDEQDKLIRLELYDGEGNLTQTENY